MKITKYIVVVSLAAALLVPTVSLAQNTTDIQAKIAALIQQIKQLQAQLNALQSQQGTAWCHTFNVNLRVGDSSEDTYALNTALDKEGFHIVLSDRAREPLFNESFASAVTGFQEKYRDEILTPNGLKNGTGYVGPATRKKLNKLYGCDSISNPVLNSSSALSNTTPQLISPTSGAVLDNGRSDRRDSIVWDFDWSDVKGATAYEIDIIQNSGSITHNNTKIVFQSFYHYVSESAVIAEANRYGWSWKVRALVNGNWGDWSKARLFEVEPINTDQLGLPPHITILSPNGGEIWAIGSKQTIKWSSLNVPFGQLLDMGIRGFGSFTQMGEDGKLHTVSQKDFPLIETSNTGSINIDTSNLQPGTYQVFIKTSVNSVLASDFSDAPFSIVAQ